MTSLSAAAAPAPPEPALFAHLIDDAAVFPPGLAALPDALREHRAHLTRWYAALLGPLLVPASDAPVLAALVGPADPPLRVGLVARPGTPLAAVSDALHLLGGHPAVEVDGVEVGWTPEWRDLDLGAVPLTLEVPRGEDLVPAVADLAADAEGSGDLRAKFRTGATPVWDWPDEGQLAVFLRAAGDRGLPFKLTGGLHHAVRGTHTLHGHAEEQHGLLNVLCAVDAALDGADAQALAGLLAERDPGALVRLVTGLGSAQAARVRSLFTAYGCCGVTDPVGELSTLNLIRRPE